MIRQRLELANGYCFVESSNGIYDRKAIDIALRLNTAISIKKQVEREVDWFASGYLQPNSVQEHPTIEAIREFKSLMWCHGPYGQEIGSLGMDPSRLAWLSGTSFLSCDHMIWIKKKLNAMQTEALCLYLNYVIKDQEGTERIVMRLTRGRPEPPKSLVFIINVGKMRSGDVYIGSDEMMGNHYSVCVVDNESTFIYYCDSLGWGPPLDLMSKVRRIYSTVYKKEMAGFTIFSCHDYNLANPVHFCDKSKCATFFPFQTNGNICGVVAIVVAAIACLAKPFFKYITKVHQLRCRHVPHLYLQKPSQYGRYLRRVVMSWIADDQINIKHLVPEETVDLEDINVEMPSDSDSEPEVARGKLTKTLNRNIKSEVREVKSKTTQKSNGFHGKGKSGEGHKIHKCKHCPFETKKSSNLKRHVSRLHEGMEEHEAEGNCRCIQCGFRCQKILHLRDHLSKDHKILFQQENRVFDTYEGKNMNQRLISSEWNFPRG